MKKRLALLLLLLLPAGPRAQLPQRDRPAPLVFTHVTVIDVTGLPSKPDTTVIVEGNRITAVGRTGEVRVREGAQAVDATGKFLIPGLWDMHVHTLGKSREPSFFPLFVAHGVTGVRDMHTVLPLEQVARIRRDIAAGEALAPRVVSSGPLVDGPHRWNHTGSLLVSNAGEARRAVDSLADGGIDFIKVYDGLAREAYFAIVEQAKRRGIPFAGHIPTAVSAQEAADAGQGSVEHMYELSSPCPATAAGSTPCDRVIAAFKRNGTRQVPTLVLYWSQTVAPSLLSDWSRIRYMSSETRERWRGYVERGAKEQAGRARAEYETLSANLRLLHQAGVAILAGTDVGNPFLMPGFSLHDELDLFVKAGMTPLDALRTATINPATYLNRQDELGTIEQGKLADMVLLDANPLDDIGNARKIRAVVVNGRLLDRKALDELLARVEASAF